MKRRYTFLLFILFSLLPLPFIISVFGEEIFYGALWDAISFQIVYISAILLYLMTFIQTKYSSKNFFIYKLMWLQEMFIISGLFGTIIGFVLTLISMGFKPDPGVDPTMTLISNLAIAMITIVYGFMGALTVYLIQKYYEMKHVKTDNINVEKPKEGFLISSLICFLLLVGFNGLAIQIGSQNMGGIKVLLSFDSIIYNISILIIFILFYRGNSFINLIKNLFWYVPDTETNIIKNLKYIRDMKKILAMIICIALLCAPIVMLASFSFPSEVVDDISPFLGLKNGGLQFMWILYFIILLTIIEGREVSKLYFETGEISAGDRFYSIKYILAPSFLLFFTFTFGIMISFLL